MKLLVKVVVATTFFATSYAANAQADNAGVTRQQVRQELVELEQAGYNPFSEDARYPNDIQSARVRIQAQQRQEDSAYGSGASGSTASGARKTDGFQHGIYFGH